MKKNKKGNYLNMDNDVDTEILDNLSLIACVDRNWNVVDIHSALSSESGPTNFFNQLTVCNTVIADKYMLDNIFPNKKPLFERQNIILSDSKEDMNSLKAKYTKEGYVTLKVMDNIVDLLIYIDVYFYKKIYVVGSVDLYKKLYKYCKRFYIMYVNDILSSTNNTDKNILYVNDYLINKGVRNKGIIVDIDTRDRYQVEEYIING